eukprot:SAG11_NODE_6167_length_1373_cov_0.809262_1_plen_138_part_00
MLAVVMQRSETQCKPGERSVLQLPEPFVPKPGDFIGVFVIQLVQKRVNAVCIVVTLSGPGSGSRIRSRSIRSRGRIECGELAGNLSRRDGDAGAVRAVRCKAQAAPIGLGAELGANCGTLRLLALIARAARIEGRIH